ncbi:MAG: PKD domain-containing protein, partial [Spirochaetaceae bacterium]|nr:PKD domain-containing protein [Spirochaetaceae bacterium]
AATSPNTAGPFDFIIDYGDSTDATFSGTYDGGDSRWEVSIPNHTYGPGIYSPKIMAIDQYGTPSVYSAPLTVTVNTPVDPYCGFTTDLLKGTSPLTVTGTAFADDDDGSISSYHWDFDHINGGEYTNSTTSTTNVQAHDYTYAGGPAFQDYNISLFVEDNAANTSNTAGSTVRVYKNVAPVSAFNKYPDGALVEGVDIFFDGSASYDPNSASSNGGDDSISTYSWTILKDGADTGVSIGNVSQFTHTFSSFGVYRVELTVTDAKGGLAGTTVYNEFTVRSIPAISEFTATPNSGLNSVTAEFAATASVNPSASSVTFSLDYQNDGTIDYTSTDSTSPYTLPVSTAPSSVYSVGTSYAALYAEDDLGNRSGTQVIPISVGSSSAPQNPVSSFYTDPLKATSPASFDFIATGYDPDGAIFQWNWTFSGSTSSSAASVSGPDPSNPRTAAYTFNGPGDSTTYNITLSTDDNDSPSNNSGNTTRTVTVYRNQEPVPSFTKSHGDLLEGVNITFDGSGSSDPNADPLTNGGDGSVDHFSWSIWKENSSAVYVDTGIVIPDTEEFVHQFNTEGKYKVELLVTDDKGLVSSTPYGDEFFIYRDPREIVIVLDHSGSMESNYKWETAKTSTELFINVLNAMNEGKPSYAKDRIALLSYTGNNSFFNFFMPWPFGFEHTTSEFAMLDLQQTPLVNTGGLFDYESISDSDFTGQIYNMTPTGQALCHALDAFASYEVSGGTDREKYIVLLTDGQNNSGYYDLNVVTGGDYGVPNYLNAFTNPEIRDTKIFSIVVGDDSYSWPSEVSNLSSIYTNGEYQQSQNPGKVIEYFSQVLSTAVDGNPLIVSDTSSVSVNTPEDKIIFAASWKQSENGSNPYHLRVSHSGGAVILPNTSFTNVTVSNQGATDSYSFYIVDKPLSDGSSESPFQGDWTLDLVEETAPGTYTPVTVASESFYTIVDLYLDAQFSIDDGAHYLGDKIILTASITEEGKPVKGAHVQARITSPGESIGELLSSYSFTSRNIRNSNALTSATHQLKTEPPSLILSHTAYAIKQRGGDSIRLNTSEVTLKDDGLGSDQIAGDGIYTAEITETGYEGNYELNFTATGQTEKGLGFERKYVLSQYVQARADVSNSFSDIILSSDMSDKGMRGATIVFEPRDAFNN